MRPLPLLAVSFNCDIAEKSDVKSESLIGADELPVVVVVPPDPVELLLELPQALVARTTPTVTAPSAAHFETRMA